MRERLIGPYVAAVCLAAAAVIAGAAHGGFGTVEHTPVPFVLGAVVILAAELRPVRIFRRGETGEICASTTFAFALLISHGLFPAVVAQAVGSVIGDAVGRKSPTKIVFNVAQYSLALGAAAAVLDHLHAPHPFLAPGQGGVVALAAVGFAGLAYFLTNNLLVCFVVALADHSELMSYLTEEFAFQAGTAGLLLGLAPIAVVVGSRAPILVPFLVVPVAAVYFSARVSFDKQHQAMHDSLTGLANRGMYRDEAERAMGMTKPGQMLAVMLIDLDRFKEVNDTLGHHTGDRLLCEVGPRLAAQVPGIDAIARLGGDEFALLVGGLDDAAAALAVATQIVRALELPFIFEDTLKLEVEASIGIALYPIHGQDVETLLQRADVAMYLAKEAHSGSEVYSSERDHNSPRRLAMLGELRNAISEPQLVLHYQPKLDLASGTVRGAEALIRWQHPKLGLLAPSEFIPLAERTGLIEPLTNLVLEQAFSQWRAWSMEGPDVRIAVNLSARNLHDVDLPRRMADLLGSYRMPPEAFEVEITESAIMQDPARALRVLRELDEMSVRLIIDDFGTGYSSLAYLKGLPVAELKIDRSFVAQMEYDEKDEAIVRSTIELAHNLGLDVTAEGVESSAVLASLSHLGCNYAQGYLIGRPVPAAQFATHGLLRSNGIGEPRHGAPSSKIVALTRSTAVH